MTAAHIKPAVRIIAIFSAVVVLLCVSAYFPLFPLLAFFILFPAAAEIVPLVIGLRVHHSRAMNVLLVANTVSFLAMIDLLGVCYLIGVLVSASLIMEFGNKIWHYSVFATTPPVEYFVIAAWCRRRGIAFTAKRLALTVIIMNTISYALVGGLFYLISNN